ncbi:MAG: adenosine deaminase [Dongiaceae bacterium]
MKHWRVLVLAVAATLLAACASPRPQPAAPPRAADADAAHYLDAIRNNPPLLEAFLRRFPKGGDLHNHLSGAVYAESLVAWGSEAGLCIERRTMTLVGPKPCKGDATALAEAVRDPAFYAAVVDAFSMRDFVPTSGWSGHDQFFATFGRFGAATDGRTGEMLAEAATRAAADHAAYLELMLSPGMSDARKLGAAAGWDDDLGALETRLDTPAMAAAVAKARAVLDDGERKMRTLLACGTPAAKPGCEVTVRYLAQVVRIFPPEQVFAQIVLAHRLVLADPRVVGFNLVGPEDDPVALRDYDQQMRMLGYLGRQHPTVRLTLHAGELALGLVPPEELRSHIRQAVEVAGAQRIGHGVDLMQEQQPLQLAAEMARRHVLVEINLTSNDLILGVSGDRHPFPTYRQLGVPVALSTDDEGVSRIDLTHEWLRAVLTYQLTYADLKQLARNSLEYAFLSGDSLWITTQPYVLAPPCAQAAPLDPVVPPGCQALLQASDKAREQWRLEVELAKVDTSIHSSDTHVPDVAEAQ